MSLSAEEQALFDHAKNTLPRFLTASVSSTLEWLYAFVAVMEAARSQVSEWIQQSYLETASGRWLDQHARDRGTARRENETDDTLRERLRQYEDMLTYPAIKASVDAVITGSGVSGECDIVYLRRDRAHAHATGSSTAFAGRGYRCGLSSPMGYVVILPYGSTTAMGAAVEEYLRQYGPAGYYFMVEIRGVP